MDNAMHEQGSIKRRCAGAQAIGMLTAMARYNSDEAKVHWASWLSHMNKIVEDWDDGTRLIDASFKV